MTPRATVRAGLGLVLLAATATGCVAKSADAPGAGDADGAAVATPAQTVPWDAIDTFLDVQRGRYTEVTGVSTDAYVQQPLMQQTVRFDLAAPYIERTLSLPDGLRGADTPPGDLRFVSTDVALLMWHPGTLEQCGTHWIDMSEALSGDIAGLGLSLQPSDLLAITPLELIEAAVGEPTHIKSTDAGSTYEVTVPAEMGMPMSSAMLGDQAAVEAVLDIDVVAEVVLPADGGSMTISGDFSEAYQVLDPAAGLPTDAVIRTSWSLTPDIPAFDTTLPTDVADPSCMDPGTTA